MRVPMPLLSPLSSTSQTLLVLVWKSLANRKATAGLTIFSIALSVALLLSVERLRHQARESFANTISGTDLIVGARSGQLQLLLYSVFRIGNATNNITWRSYQDIANHKAVAWSVPISLGDSHKGFRVMGTTPGFFQHYRYGRKQSLKLAKGKVFEDLFDTVIGATVARKLGYRIGDKIIIAHGLGQIGITKHEQLPFKISGILKPTGTPVDKTVIVSLRAIEAIHADWKYGTRLPGAGTPADELRKRPLTPRAVTAVLLGLKSKLQVFRMQRAINNYRAEPLLAILPGVALQELWDLMGTAEAALLMITWFVVIAAITGMLAMILASLNERRREMAILRANGARPSHIVALMTMEAGLLALMGAIAGTLFHYLLTLLAQPLIEAEFGLTFPLTALSAYELKLLAIIVLSGWLAGLYPAYRAYRYTLSDGMMVRT